MDDPANVAAVTAALDRVEQAPHVVSVTPPAAARSRHRPSPTAVG
ncbi:hypothetical protein [Micromonospora sp. Llam0]|nr:hypothetical protein [Micromonospora sp. Llam0]